MPQDLRRNYVVWGRCVAGLLGCLIGLLAASGAAAQLADEPLMWRNSSVVAATAGLPRARSASLPQPGETRADVLLEFASHFSSRADADQSVWLDGETASLVGRFEHGLAPGWAVSLELTALQHSGGFLDGIINQWHDWFGLPDSGRDDVASDQLLMVWQVAGEQRFLVTERQRGMADLRLGLARTLHVSDARDIALRLDVELPTGSAASLRGSGGVNLAASLVWSEREALAHWGLVSHAGLGMVRPTGDDLLGDSLQDWVGIGYWTLAWPVTERLVLKGQLDGHTRLSDSGLREVGGWSLQGGLGAAWQMNHGHALEFAIYEDLRPDSAPDVSFQFALRSRF